MKNRFWLDCNTVMDMAYEAEKENSLPVLSQIQIGLHLLFCPVCAGELQNLRCVEEIMRTDFLPPAPDFEESVMAQVYEETNVEEQLDAPAGFSFRLWVIIGFFVLFSLSSSFFGMNVVEIIDEDGLSFLLPLGITIGMIVTSYGALFIGSHLKELSDRFRLR